MDGPADQDPDAAFVAVKDGEWHTAGELEDAWPVDGEPEQ